MNSGGDLRERLITAAERLFAERGLEAVSLREINAAAGTRNASALQYHFGDRAGLVRAVLARHDTEVEARRHALLDQYEADGRPDLHTLVAALVRPLAAELDAEGGVGYLQVLADVLNRPRPPFSAPEDPDTSTHRWRALVLPMLDPLAVSHHRRFLAVRFTITELARRPRVSSRTDHALFVSDLIDLVTGLLAAPVSAGTRAASRARAQGHV
ncbi:helix-turn-helix domain-containing protein [Actinocorallia longicatena]|uniref:TetR/AcrR family transcriptional regulator n=1 Tax=Actinocorallia longicatena TaxID=111803 RepID=A0ABP6QM49_9ACTN